MDGCTKPKKPKEDYASLKEALKDYDSGLNVDTATLSRLASQEQGSYECEFFFGEEDDLQKMYTNCKKNPGHKNFILLKNLNLDSLPLKCRHQTVLETIKLQGALTVKLNSRYVSKDRPDLHPRSGKRYAHSNIKGNRTFNRVGTGMVFKVVVEKVEGQTCCCDECQVDGGDAKTWYRVVIATALHVIYDQSEADQTKVEFSLQTEDGVNVSETLKGGWNHEQINSDVATLSAFTHDERLCSNLIRVKDHFYMHKCLARDWLELNLLKCDAYSFSSIVSHPHGLDKHVSLGNFLSEVPFGKMLCPEGKSTPLSPLSASVSKILRSYLGDTTTIYNTPTCPGSSGSFVFRYRCNHVSIHERTDHTEGFNMAGDDSDLNFFYNSEKDVSKMFPIPRIPFIEDYVDVLMNEVREKYLELITWIENLTKSEVDEIIALLAMIVKELDDVGLQESPGQEGASMAGTASLKDTIRTEFVKLLKSYNGEDLLARNVNDTPMKYTTTSGLKKIIREMDQILLHTILYRFCALSLRKPTEHISTSGFIEVMTQIMRTSDDVALDSDLPAQKVQQRTIMNAKNSKAALLSDVVDFLICLRTLLDVRREAWDGLVEEIQSGSVSTTPRSVNKLKEIMRSMSVIFTDAV